MPQKCAGLPARRAGSGVGRRIDAARRDAPPPVTIKCMSEHLHSRRLFRSALVTITDVDCCAPQGGCGAEEFTTADEIVFPRGGIFERRLGTRRIVGDPARVQYFRRADGYRISHPAEGGDRCTVLSLNETLLSDLLAGCERATPGCGPAHLPFLDGPMRDADFLDVHRLRRAARDSAAEPLEIEECALAVAGSVLSLSHVANGHAAARRHRGSTTAAHREIADAARQHLAASFDRVDSLAQIARAVHSSPFHLARLFRGCTGMSLHQHRTRLRMAAALQRLNGGAQDLTHLAFELGYSSHSRFTAAFRACFGCTPSQFRGLSRRTQVSTIRTAGGRGASYLPMN